MGCWFFGAIGYGVEDVAEGWYDLAVAPVDERYRRRMRVFPEVGHA